MTTTFGARGEGGHSLARKVRKYKENLARINFADRKKRKPDKVRGGRKTYRYGDSKGCPDAENGRPTCE